LEADYSDIERRLGSPDWETLKSKLSAEMASVDFWNRADRFSTLARLALMDRVKHANETAEALHARLARYAKSPRGYSAELCGRLALQLHLVDEGIKDIFDNSPVEIVLTVEPVFDGTADHHRSLAWCHRLTAMYRAWADKRRMQFSVHCGTNQRGADCFDQRLRRVPGTFAGGGAACLRTIGSGERSGHCACPLCAGAAWRLFPPRRKIRTYPQARSKER
jgi:hypothetical protein